MRIARKLKLSVIGAVMLLTVGGNPRAQERPLPEVAKEKRGKTAGRVFTNEDLEAARPPAVSPAAPVTMAEPPTAAVKGGGARITIPGLLEEGTISQARATLDSLKQDEKVLLRRYAQIQEKLSSETDQHLRQLYSNSLVRRDETLARKRAQIEQVEKAIKGAESGRASPPRSKHEAETGVEK